MEGRLVPRAEALALAIAERAVEFVISARVDINRCWTGPTWTACSGGRTSQR